MQPRFHRDCIDIWLATRHLPCLPQQPRRSRSDYGGRPWAIPIGELADREAELSDLVQSGEARGEVAVTATRSRLGSVRRMPMNLRSTEDWAAAIAEEQGEVWAADTRGCEKGYWLPDRLRRSRASCFSVEREEGSSRRGYREGASRGWRTPRLGRSGGGHFWGELLNGEGKSESVSDGSSTRGRTVTAVGGRDFHGWHGSCENLKVD
ncbi:hypothetical protein HPP92_001932 [Vanilla planifolia]|uniref:Uncharacterized protein n=1 Tax=Vanilla planifolia TaxID=51239 RepID=A0A835S094_VANPL|nr:hypothetical protein HPP92_002175 [Vanilla planifolia]KAG0501860.1 hypothetical protein HPP92_001932 [Vanilla planifolia]